MTSHNTSVRQKILNALGEPDIVLTALQTMLRNKCINIGERLAKHLPTYRSRRQRDIDIWELIETDDPRKWIKHALQQMEMQQEQIMDMKKKLESLYTIGTTYEDGKKTSTRGRKVWEFVSLHQLAQFDGDFDRCQLYTLTFQDPVTLEQATCELDHATSTACTHRGSITHRREVQLAKIRKEDLEIRKGNTTAGRP